MWRILSDFLGMGLLYLFTIKGRYVDFSDCDNNQIKLMQNKGIQLGSYR